MVLHTNLTSTLRIAFPLNCMRSCLRRVAGYAGFRLNDKYAASVDDET